MAKYPIVRSSLGMIAVILFASQSFSQTARDYYNELYKAGGLDRMADRYVCFTDDPKQENFFIFGESKDIRESMMADGKFAKMPKAFQDQFKKDWIIVRPYNKGVPFEQEYLDKNGESWVSEERMLDKKNPFKMKFTISWAAAAALSPVPKLRFENPHTNFQSSPKNTPSPSSNTSAPGDRSGAENSAPGS
jgi:hypothetical protein